jgi:hypothetical protein
MLSKGNKALETILLLKISGCAVGVGQGKSPLTPFLSFIVLLWDERDEMLVV